MTTDRIALDLETATRLAGIALANIGREYPHKLDHVLAGDADCAAPRVLHPAFHGSYDWHSCVHMHWLLARLRRRFPALPQRALIDALFARNFAPGAIATEVRYLARPNSDTFERPYGWAWLLKLACELRAGADAQCVTWSSALAPLADAFAARFVEFLPRARYPMRYGVHSSTAFALGFALDYASAANDRALAASCIAKAREWYGGDRAAPAGYEPSGSDFLSPSLIEALLMRRVVARDAFADWLAAFLPEFGARLPLALFTPVEVGDRSDSQLVHLDGLNLSRAWCFRGIAAALPTGDPRVAVAQDAAERHLAAGWRGLASEHFVGAHWLASFAVLALEPPEATP